MGGIHPNCSFSRQNSEMITECSCGMRGVPGLCYQNIFCMFSDASLPCFRWSNASDHWRCMFGHYRMLTLSLPFVAIASQVSSITYVFNKHLSIGGHSRQCSKAYCLLPLEYLFETLACCAEIRPIRFNWSIMWAHDPAPLLN